VDDPVTPQIDTRPLRQALGGFATGVCVVTAVGPGGPIGITVNSFTSVSLDPPTILWSLGRRSDRWPTFSEAAHFAIHVLDAGGLEACQRFAWGDPVLDESEYQEGLGGVPLIGGWVSRFECRTERRIDAKDHLLILGHVERFESREGEALVFYRGAYGPVGGG
jgi:flavin reductase (DIM6/NTAB) family NADH-FMN oxidoreductase RutF